MVLAKPLCDLDDMDVKTWQVSKSVIGGDDAKETKKSK